jgi:hypothetical protein
MKIAICASVFAVALAIPASASLLTGQTVQSTYLFPNTSTIFSGPTNSVVAGGVELVSFAGLANVDFSDMNILITLTRDAGVNNVAFDGFSFFDVNGTIPAITSVSLNGATNYAGFTGSRITFDADHVFVNVANLPGLNGQEISIDLNAAAAVPEPGTLSMMVAGMMVAGLAVIGRLRRRRA